MFKLMDFARSRPRVCSAVASMLTTSAVPLRTATGGCPLFEGADGQHADDCTAWMVDAHKKTRWGRVRTFSAHSLLQQQRVHSAWQSHALRLLSPAVQAAQVQSGRVLAKAERERQREEQRLQKEMEKARAAQVWRGRATPGLQRASGQPGGGGLGAVRGAGLSQALFWAGWELLLFAKVLGRGSVLGGSSSPPHRYVSAPWQRATPNLNRSSQGP